MRRFFKEKLFKSLNNKKTYQVKNYSGAWGDKEIFNINFFEENISLNFERINVKAPKKYDEYLKCMYGNYKKLPPIDKQISQHACEIIDLNESYKNYGYK